MDTKENEALFNEFGSSSETSLAKLFKLIKLFNMHKSTLNAI